MSKITALQALNQYGKGSTLVPRFRISFIIDGTEYDIYANHLFPESCQKLNFRNELLGAICLKEPTEELAIQIDCTINTSLKARTLTKMSLFTTEPFMKFVTTNETPKGTVLFVSSHPQSQPESIILHNPRITKIEIISNNDSDATESQEKNVNQSHSRQYSDSSTQTLSEETLELDNTISDKIIILLNKVTKSYGSALSFTNREYFRRMSRCHRFVTASVPQDIESALNSYININDTYSLIYKTHRRDEFDTFLSGEIHQCQFGVCYLNQVVQDMTNDPQGERTFSDRVREFNRRYIDENFIIPLRPTLLLELAEEAATYKVSAQLFGHELDAQESESDENEDDVQQEVDQITTTDTTDDPTIDLDQLFS